MNSMFWDTVAGHRFTEITIPQLTNSIKDLTCAIQKSNEQVVQSQETIMLRHSSTAILDVFETLLDEHGIYIPDSSRMGETDEACLYGETYSNLEADILDILQDLCQTLSKNPSVTLDSDNLSDVLIKK